MNSFGDRIKQLRIEKSITQKDLAEILNIRNTTISAWEKDVAEPPYETLKKICLIFDVSADYLLGLEDEDGHKEPAEYEFKYKDNYTQFIHREKK